MCTEGPDDEQYIVKGYTVDQAGQDIRDEDVIQAANSVWYTKAEIKTWRDKTTAGIPTYGSCVRCYWGGPVGLKCTHCDGKITRNLTYQVHESRGKILDSHWVARYFEKGHDVAKANRKHRRIRTGTVQLPPFGKFEKMLRRGKVRGKQQVDNRSVLEKMRFCSRYTSLTHMSEEFGQDLREFGASRGGSLLSNNQCLLTSSGLIPE